MKTKNNKGWFFVLPVVVVVAFSAVIPLMTVVNYAFNDSFGQNEFFWVGFEWFREVLEDERIQASFFRQVSFSAIILTIELPLGVAIALCMPKRGIWVSVCLVLMAMPLLIPWNVVGTIWQVFSRVDIGLLGYTINSMGIDFNIADGPWSAWILVIVMDVWHWTSLVVLLAYAGLQSMPVGSIKPAAGRCLDMWSFLKFEAF